MNTTATTTYRFQQKSDIRSSFRASRTTSAPPFSSSLNRLFSAAVASSRFRRLLLTDPITAVSAGYNGETFSLTADEFGHVVTIQATSLREFAAQLVKRFELNDAAKAHSATRESSPVPHRDEGGIARNEERSLPRKEIHLKRL